MAKMVEVKTKTEGRQHFWLDDGETVCKKCKGAGRWDSCWHCGNRGYMFTDGRDC